MQCEAWRPLQLPGILVADPRLGGISATISAYETLALRGSPPVALVMMQQAQQEAAHLTAGVHLDVGGGFVLASCASVWLPGHCQCPFSRKAQGQPTAWPVILEQAQASFGLQVVCFLNPYEHGIPRLPGDLLVLSLRTAH